MIHNTILAQAMSCTDTGTLSNW